MRTTDRSIRNGLLLLIAVDAILVVWAFGFPDLWFALFHHDLDGSEGARLFLRRCGAAWAAFLVLQILALRNYEKGAHWLAIVAGVRLSDALTDPMYVVLASDPTWVAYLLLPGAGVVNIVFGWFFLSAYLQRSATR
jgi:hypothetical protein